MHLFIQIWNLTMVLLPLFWAPLAAILLLQGCNLVLSTLLAQRALRLSLLITITAVGAPGFKLSASADIAWFWILWAGRCRLVHDHVWTRATLLQKTGDSRTLSIPQLLIKERVRSTFRCCSFAPSMPGQIAIVSLVSQLATRASRVRGKLWQSWLMCLAGTVDILLLWLLWAKEWRAV